MNKLRVVLCIIGIVSLLCSGIIKEYDNVATNWGMVILGIICLIPIATYTINQLIRDYKEVYR